MDNIGSLLDILHYGDSFFPSGAVSFSWGLEAMVSSGLLARSKDVQDFVIGQLHARWASFDRTIVTSAHRVADNLDAVGEIDELVECLSPIAEFRQGSCRMGDAMLSVFQRLGSPAAHCYRERQKTLQAPAHLTVMQGLLWAEAGLSETAAVALSAHTFCTSLASAGLRLGCLTHISAQTLLTAARMEAAEIAALPLVPLERISTYGIEAEIAVMRHAAKDMRLFAN
jgi:urease accessory protein